MVSNLDMKKIIIIISVLLILFGTILFLLSRHQNISGAVVSDRYTFTKAICNETNFCQDYEITCEGNNTISITPMTGAFIQHSESWKDKRTQEEKNKLCG